jgi:hypothetical protein
MNMAKNVVSGFAVVAMMLLGGAPAGAQEKRTVYTENDFHW